MNIPQAIDHNKAVLARIIAGLFALLGGTAALARIPAELHRSIARVLLSAESAVRRLIVVLARITNVKAPPLRPRPAPAGLVRAGEGQERLSFQLFDPRQRFFRRKYKAKTGPQPRITFFGDGNISTISWGQDSRKVTTPPKTGDGLENSAHLLRRLEALKAALDNLPRQARRMVRALARRQKSERLKLKMPLRPGRAPGYRVKPRLDIDHVLHQCDWLARETLAPDTS